MKLLKWISFAVVASFIVSCYPEKERSIADFDIVGTQFADNIVFEDYKTFYLHDSVVIVYDTTEEKPDFPVEESNLIINTMRQNLLSFGWQELTRDSVLAGDTPDVYLEASMWSSTVVGAIYYPGWGYPGWGWGWKTSSSQYYGGSPYYPYYPGGGTSYYSYTTGTVMMFMLDIKNHPFDDSPAVVMWNGGLNGLLSSSGSSNLSRIENSVNKAFNQSQYLNHNK